MKINNPQIDIEELCNFTPKQHEASIAVKRYKFVLFGGGMGGGKSYFLRWKLLRILLAHASRGHHHVTVGLFCENYPSLEDRHILKIKYEFPSWLGQYSITDHNFVLKPEYGSGIIAFRNLDDASKYQSSEFAAIGVDELTRNNEEIFIFLRTRLRWPGIDDVKFIGATNPGGVGNIWVKNLWIDKMYSLNEQESDQFVYVRGLLGDNPYVNLPSYVKTLESLPENRRKAYLEGSWDIVEGQYFKEWSRERHTCAPHKIPFDAKKFICIDYGLEKPSAVYWYYRDPDGIIYVYRELHEKGLLYNQLAEKISALTPPSEIINCWIADPSLWRRGGETGITGAEIMANTYQKIRNKLPNLIPGNNERIAGWNVLHSYLRPISINDREIPKLQIFTTCTNLIRTLPTLVHDTQNPEDLDTHGEDHAADALRYGLMHDFPNSPEPKRQIPPTLLTPGDHISEMLDRRPPLYPYEKPNHSEYE